MMELPTMKWCWACREDKPLTDFHSDRTTKDGRAYTCRQCFKERYTARQKAYRRTEAKCVVCHAGEHSRSLTGEGR